jgi:hypothetical protein
MKWFLSFCDEEKPEGERFVGASVVEADSVEEATREAWRKGCNPGVDMLAIEFPADVPVPDECLNRLMSREELEAYDEVFGGLGFEAVAAEDVVDEDSVGCVACDAENLRKKMN